MNQILNFGKNNSVSEGNTKTVIKFFAIIIIIFALILGGIGIYNMYFSKEKVNAEIPTMSCEQDGSSAKLIVSCNGGIDKIMYTWNNGEEAIIQANGKTKVEEKLPMPIGTNTLNISVVDSKGKMTRFGKKEFKFDSSIDTNKPEIQVVKGSGNGIIKIMITDDKGIQSVKYQWDGDEEVISNITEGNTVVEIEVAAKEGENTLIITAIDISDNEEKVDKIIKGTKKPEVTVGKKESQLVIKVKDEDKIGKIEYTLNGETKTIEGINQPTYEFIVDLAAGENLIIINAYDTDGLVTEYKGKCKN